MVGCEHPHCIGQTLEDPLRGQPYQAPVSKHILASAIVSGFGVCRWDGSLGGAISEWPFLQSLLYPFVPAFPLERNNSGIIFLRWVCSPIPQPREVPNRRIWSLQVLCFPLLDILTNVSPVRSWKPLAFLSYGTFLWLPLFPHPPAT
jgi:hypothetical protein